MAIDAGSGDGGTKKDMADPATAYAVGAGTELVGSGIGAIGQARENKRQAGAAAQSAATINDVIEKYILPSDTSGMEWAAAKSLASNQSALNANLASRGIYNSGTANRAHAGLAAETYTGLADAINADQANRAGMALEGYSSEAFGFYDPATGQPTNQGK